MDWSRYRTLGSDLLIVGILVLLVSSGFAFDTVCPAGGVCTTQVDWPTLSPAVGLLIAGGFVTVMARRQKQQTG